MGVYPSLMRQWTTIARSPTPPVLRRVAALFDTPVSEVLVAAGYMTEDENVPLPATRTLLQQMSNKQILDEIRRRTAGDAGGPPIPVRVNGVLHTPDGLPTVLVSNTMGRPSVPTSSSPTARRLGASPALFVTTSQVRRASRAGGSDAKRILPNDCRSRESR